MEIKQGDESRQTDGWGEGREADGTQGNNKIMGNKVKLLNKKKSRKSLSLYKIVFVSLCSDSESLRQTRGSTQRNGHKLVERKVEEELEDAVKISIGVNSQSAFEGLSYAKFSGFVKCETCSDIWSTVGSNTTCQIICTAFIFKKNKTSAYCKR